MASILWQRRHVHCVALPETQESGSLASCFNIRGQRLSGGGGSRAASSGHFGGGAWGGASVSDAPPPPKERCPPGEFLSGDQLPFWEISRPRLAVGSRRWHTAHAQRPVSAEEGGILSPQGGSSLLTEARADAEGHQPPALLPPPSRRPRAARRRGAGSRRGLRGRGSLALPRRRRALPGQWRRPGGRDRECLRLGGPAHAGLPSASRPGGSMAEPEAPRGKSLPELREMLRRQERLLADRKFLSRLPDKGKKISAFAVKLKVAITHEEEQRRRTELLSKVRLEFQQRQEKHNSHQCRIAASEENSACKDSPLTSVSHANEELGSTVQNQSWILATKTEGEPGEQTHGDSNTHKRKDSVSEASAASGFPHRNPHGSAGGCQEALVEALERISIGGRGDEEASGKGPGSECRENPSQGLPLHTPKTPHYVEVLEMRSKNPVAGRSTFKPNRIPAELSGSSCSSSEAPSPISAEERRRREKQHLDDITAARLPVLHHTPAQLLPLGESLALQIQQKAAYEEMQAKLAAQKLAQKLGIQMVPYEPEGEAGVRYQEVKDEEAYSSAED